MASSVLALFFVVVALSTLATLPAAAQHGCDPGNLIPNCDFEQSSGDLPAGWAAQVLSGQVGFRLVSGSASHSSYGQSSLLLSSNDAYVATINTRSAMCNRARRTKHRSDGGPRRRRQTASAGNWASIPPAARSELTERRRGVSCTGVMLGA